MSTIRWLILDSLHHATGIRAPDWDFSRLADRVEGFSLLVEIHYRFYQFYGNTIVAITFAYTAWMLNRDFARLPAGWPELAFVMLLALFFLGSRDTLRKYYARLNALLPLSTDGATR
jgi:hypothetical protein